MIPYPVVAAALAGLLYAAARRPSGRARSISLGGLAGLGVLASVPLECSTAAAQSHSDGSTTTCRTAFSPATADVDVVVSSVTLLVLLAAGAVWIGRRLDLRPPRGRG